MGATIVKQASIKFPGNFAVQSQAPIDARSVVGTYEDLLDIQSFVISADPSSEFYNKCYLYKGMTVTVADTGVIYVFMRDIPAGEYNAYNIIGYNESTGKALYPLTRADWYTSSDDAVTWLNE